jgi:hypothetical protein
LAERAWIISQVSFCDHINQEVALEAELLFPADFLPDPPRLLSHRCSQGLQCNLFTQPACIWAGTNPNNDPFLKV